MMFLRVLNIVVAVLIALCAMPSSRGFVVIALLPVTFAVFMPLVKPPLRVGLMMLLINLVCALGLFYFRVHGMPTYAIFLIATGIFFPVVGMFKAMAYVGEQVGQWRRELVGINVITLLMVVVPGVILVLFNEDPVYDFWFSFAGAVSMALCFLLILGYRISSRLRRAGKV